MAGWGANSIQAVWFLQGWSSKKNVDQIFSALVGKRSRIQPNYRGRRRNCDWKRDGQQIYRVQMQPGRNRFFPEPSPCRRPNSEFR